MVYAKQIEAPWIPVIKNKDDVSWFEKYPESKEQAKPLTMELEQLFHDF